jgi:hypothetical protein
MKGTFPADAVGIHEIKPFPADAVGIHEIKSFPADALGTHESNISCLCGGNS